MRARDREVVGVGVGRVGGGGEIRVVGVEGDGLEALLRLELERRFDYCGDEAGVDVPFDVAVEEPDLW